MSINEEIFNTSYRLLTSKIRSPMTPENMMIYVKLAMELTEITELKGAEQKQLVIDIIRKVVEDNANKDYKKLCEDFIDSGTLSQTIDIIVDATKGRLNINNNSKSLIKRIVVCCLPFLNRTITNEQEISSEQVAIDPMVRKTSSI